MQREPLDFKHKDLLSRRLKKIASPLSEYSFANLFLFRHAHAYEVILGDHVFIRGRSYDGRVFIMLTEPPDRIGTSCLRDVLADADFFYPIPDEWLAHFPADQFEIHHRSGDADYIYTVEKMSTYAGRKLHKKRNLLKQFVRSYSHEALPLTNERLPDARFILDEWVKASKLDHTDSDADACREALDLYEELVLCGGIVYADGEPAGFVLGEELNEDTFVLHFAKARTKFAGVYQYLFNSFAKVLPPKYRFLNLEQDLDKENLRMFKSSYQPDALLRKARLALLHPALTRSDASSYNASLLHKNEVNIRR